MYNKGKKKGTVRFAFSPGPDASQVAVAGDFSVWQAVPMNRQRDGTYVRNIHCIAETFEYKFLVDADWVLDPDNNQWARNPYGSLNSVGLANGEAVPLA